MAEIVAHYFRAFYPIAREYARRRFCATGDATSRSRLVC